MGRKSRLKRERREAARTEPFTRLKRESGLRVLATASVSPTASYRLCSILTAFVELLRRPRDGKIEAGAEHLDELLEGIPDEVKLLLPMQEDFVPVDVRYDVRARWRDGLYRLVPGGFEAPVSIIESARFHARVLDPHLRARVGFGIGDLVELVLRASDAAVSALDSVWPDDEVDRDDPVRVSAEECQAFSSLATLASLAEECRDPDAAGSAVEWATVSVERAVDVLTARHHTLGPVLAVETETESHPVPPGMLLDVVFEGVPRLRELALGDSQVAELWERAAKQEVLRTLAALGPYIAAGEVDGKPVDFLIRVEGYLVLAVCVIPTPGVGEVRRAKSRLRGVKPGVRVDVGGGEHVDIDTATEVARLVVFVDAEGMIMGSLADEVHVQTATLQELRWIVGTSERPSDLPRFLIDRTEDETRGMSFGTFDQWEVWRTGTPGPFQMGVTPSFVSWAAHSEHAEWEHHHETAWVTESLFLVGLGSVAEWTHCSVDSSGPTEAAELIDAARQRAVRVAVVGDIVVAVGWDAWDDAQLPAVNVGRAVMWRLLHAEPMVDELSEQGRVLRIQVLSRPDGDAMSVEAHRDVDGLVSLTYSTTGDGQDLSGVEVAIGRALASLSERDAERAWSAWDDSPPGLWVEARSVPFVVSEPTLFTPPHPAVVAAERRELARSLHDSRQQTGTYRDEDAVRLETRIDEILRSRLLSLLDGVDRSSVVQTAARTLEQLHARREADAVDADHRRQLRVAAGQAFDLDEATHAQQQLTSWARALAHVLELALTTPTGGSSGGEFTGRLQAQVAAVASLVLESGQRRAVAHFGLMDVESNISDSYEVTQTQLLGQVDLGQFARTRAAERLGDKDELDQVVYFDETDAVALNDVLKTHLGFTATTMRTLLSAAARWPVSQPLMTATTTPDELTERVLQLEGQSEPEVRAAIDWLTLRPDNLADPLDHWNVDQRNHRLASRPFVELSSTQLLIAPRSVDYADEVIGGHLTDFRSPWGFAGPAGLRDDQARLRENRNMRFEREVEAVLTAGSSFHVRRNLKQGSVVDGWVLEREVDLVVVDAHRRRIWILDVKDPAVPFAPNQIHRSVKRYHGDRGHVPKVLGSVSRAREHATGVASALLAQKCTGEWDVIGGIVSRRIEAAAFVGDPGVRFMTPHTAVQTLDADTMPSADYGAVRHVGSD